MSTYRSLLATTGCALFAMFFGSGNLVFPLLVGTTTDGYAFWSTLGLILTAVCMPLLGCIGIMLYGGNPQHFFSFMSTRAFRIFSFLALALMGPFGVLARCLTVAHGTFVTTGIDVSLSTFSLLSCLLLWGAALYRQKILQLLGGWLTPVLLLALLSIAICSLSGASSFLSSNSNSEGWQAFKLGALQGYQTMDLLAAFFFSGFVIGQLQHKMQEQKMEQSPLRLFLGATAIAGVLLAAIYALLIYLGAQHKFLLEDVKPVNMLATIATHSMGKWGGGIVSLAFALACYTTAIVLTVLFADFLRTELLKNKIPQWAAIVVTLIIAFSTSTLEFEGIAGFIGPLLETIYPLLIGITVWNIVRYPWLRPQAVTVSETYVTAPDH